MVADPDEPGQHPHVNISVPLNLTMNGSSNVSVSFNLNVNIGSDPIRNLPAVESAITQPLLVSPANVEEPALDASLAENAINTPIEDSAISNVNQSALGNQRRRELASPNVEVSSSSANADDVAPARHNSGPTQVNDRPGQSNDVSTNAGNPRVDNAPSLLTDTSASLQNLVDARMHTGSRRPRPRPRRIVNKTEPSEVALGKRPRRSASPGATASTSRRLFISTPEPRRISAQEHVPTVIQAPSASDEDNVEPGLNTQVEAALQTQDGDSNSLDEDVKFKKLIRFFMGNSESVPSGSQCNSSRLPGQSTFDWANSLCRQDGSSGEGYVRYGSETESETQPEVQPEPELEGMVPNGDQHNGSQTEPETQPEPELENIVPETQLSDDEELYYLPLDWKPNGH